MNHEKSCLKKSEMINISSPVGVAVPASSSCSTWNPIPVRSATSEIELPKDSRRLRSFLANPWMVKAITTFFRQPIAATISQSPQHPNGFQGPEALGGCGQSPHFLPLTPSTPAPPARSAPRTPHIPRRTGAPPRGSVPGRGCSASPGNAGRGTRTAWCLRSRPGP